MMNPEDMSKAYNMAISNLQNAILDAQDCDKLESLLPLIYKLRKESLVSLLRIAKSSRPEDFSEAMEGSSEAMDRCEKAIAAEMAIIMNSLPFIRDTSWWLLHTRLGVDMYLSPEVEKNEVKH